MQEHWKTSAGVGYANYCHNHQSALQAAVEVELKGGICPEAPKQSIQGYWVAVLPLKF